MANKCPDNIKYATFLSKYLGVSQGINQSTKTNRKTPPVSSSLFLLQDEGEAPQCKSGKCWSVVLSIAFAYGLSWWLRR